MINTSRNQTQALGAGARTQYREINKRGDYMKKHDYGLLIFIAAVLFLWCLSWGMGYGVILSMQASQAMAVEAPEAIEAAFKPKYEYQTPVITPTIEEDKPEPIPLGTFRVTAYCGCPQCCGIWSEEHPSRVGTDYVQRTASGTIPAEGRTVAADWALLPKGTEIIIEGHVYTVEDKGGAIKGYAIDIYYDSHKEAQGFGVQYLEVCI